MLLADIEIFTIKVCGFYIYPLVEPKRPNKKSHFRDSFYLGVERLELPTSSL